MARPRPSFRDLFRSPEVWSPSLSFASGSSPPGYATSASVAEQPRLPSAGQIRPAESERSSSAESVVGSNETESEEDDDYTAGLAEKIAHSMLDEDDTSEEMLESNGRSWGVDQRSVWATDTGKASLAVSPQSTLPGMGSWSTCSWSSSSNGSSKGSSQVSSPPSTPQEAPNDAWDLLYSEVVRLTMNDERKGSRARLPPPSGAKQPSSGAASGRSLLHQRQMSSWKQQPLAQELPASKATCLSALPSPVYCHDKPAASSPAQHIQRTSSTRSKDEDRKLSRNQLGSGKHGGAPHTRGGRQSRSVSQQQNSGSGRAGSKGGAGQRFLWAADAVSSQWPPLQPGGGSGMRAVFLGTHASGRESGGTGVFIPRRLGSGSGTLRKPTCSTVLLPARIVQALNLNVEDVRTPFMVHNAVLHQAAIQSDVAAPFPSPSAFFTGWSGDSETIQTDGMKSWVDSLEKPLSPSCISMEQAAPEVILPTEWTY